MGRGRPLADQALLELRPLSAGAYAPATTFEKPNTGANMRRSILALTLSGLALAVTASPSGAAVTLGQTGTAGATNCGSPLETLQPTVTSGPSYVAPAAGRINSW